MMFFTAFVDDRDLPLSGPQLGPLNGLFGGLPVVRVFVVQRGDVVSGDFKHAAKLGREPRKPKF
jgi:hypothetical protein